MATTSQGFCGSFGSDASSIYQGGKMKHSIATAAMLLAAVAAAPAAAEQGEFTARMRALYMQVDADTSPDLNVGVEDRWIPEVDFGYWITDNVA